MEMTTTFINHTAVLASLKAEVLDLCLDVQWVTEPAWDALIDVQVAIDEFREAIGELATDLARPRPGSRSNLSPDRIRTLAVTLDDAPEFTAGQAKAVARALSGVR